MKTTKKQFRVTFENPTAFSNKRASTMWYNSIEDCKEWMNKTNTEVITREITKDSNSLRNALNAKFNN